MKIDIQKDIQFIIVKGEIRRMTDNPWISPFLQYIEKNPKACPETLCRDLFGDNGKARVAAIKNTLFFFLNNGLLTRKNDEYTLTSEGKNASEIGKIWQGYKGCFLATVLPIEDTYLLLHLQDVPDNWYDNGKQEMEYFDAENITEFCATSFISNSPELKIDKLEQEYRPTFISNTTFDATLSNDRLKILISLKNIKGNEESFEIRFRLTSYLAQSLREKYDDDYDEDDDNEYTYN